jgi:DNA-binding beta-propeller fold protein YncE
VVRLDVERSPPRVVASAQVGGEPRAIALSPDGKRLYVALAGASRVAVLSTASLGPVNLYDVPAEPHALLPTADGRGLIVADFCGNRLLRLSAATGKVEAASQYVNRPACLAMSPARGEFYTVSFRTGEIVAFDEQCRLVRRLPAPAQLGQCRHVTLGADGLLYAPQTRSDTIVGGRTFDRTVFPAIALADLDANRVSIEYSPDLLVVPPHRPTEVAVDADTVYLASAGSDDVLAIDRRSRFARWHATNVGLEPGGIVLDSSQQRLYVLTITGQSIVTLDATTGRVLDRTRVTKDPTPGNVARGRYLFGTATDRRLTKDQWMSCAACHPDGRDDGRRWDFGDGPLDTRSLRGCISTPPLHFDGRLDEIQDTYHFTRMVMGGHWFLPGERMHKWLGEPNAKLNRDLDALAAYVESLKPDKPALALPELLPRIERGREIFFSEKTRCSSCHSPPFYTDSGRRNGSRRFVLHDVGTRDTLENKELRRLDTPSLLGLARSEPYLHDGRASTLEEVFTTFNRDDKHGRTSHLSQDDVRSLAEFLRYLALP